MTDLNFYHGKKVFVTGHTGFKGAWLCHVLRTAGAEVTGYALAPPTTPSLFDLTGLAADVRSITGDIRDLQGLRDAMNAARPDIVLHLAAQPLVREGYQSPVYTFETNVMGTVNLLECVRHCASVQSVVNVTTDKVYLNREWPWGYREHEELKGLDPYSNSKSCSELVTYSYRHSFFEGRDGVPSLPVSTARAGNVIGGGDFAKDRIIPDCVRAAIDKKPIIVRNPYSTRPYQHVLEPLFAYLMIAQRQYENPHPGRKLQRRSGRRGLLCHRRAGGFVYRSLGRRAAARGPAGRRRARSQLPQAGLLPAENRVRLAASLAAAHRRGKDRGMDEMLAKRRRCERLHGGTDCGLSRLSPYTLLYRSSAALHGAAPLLSLMILSFSVRSVTFCPCKTI